MNTAKKSSSSFIKIFYSLFGWKVWLILGLNIFATLSEAIGIVLLFPLLSLFGPNQSINYEEIGLLGLIFKDIIESLSGFFHEDDIFSVILILIGIFFLLKGIFTFCAYAVVNILNGRMMYSLRADGLDALADTNYSFYRKNMIGHYTNILSEQVQRSFSAVKHFSEFAGMLSAALIYILIAIYINWQFGLLSLSSSLIILISFRYLNKKVRNMSVLNAEHSATMQSWLIQFLRSFSYFKATNTMSSIKNNVFKAFSDLSDIKIKTGIYDSLTLSIREPILVVLILIIMYVQVKFFLSDINTILVSIILFYRGLNSTVIAQRQWQAALEFFGALDTSYNLIVTSQNNYENQEGLSIDDNEFNISLNNIKFQFKESDEFIFQIDEMHFRANKTTALIGPSGSGKSTILNLITSLEKTSSGKIVVNNTNLSDIDLKKLRSKIGYVQQKPIIYSNTIEWNITTGRNDGLSDDEREEKLMHACKMANIYDFINSQPKKFQTVLEEEGGNLSGGQQQRICLARELYKEPKILILDEASSALDYKSEMKMYETIEGLKPYMTILLVAHKLRAINFIDYIYIIDKGKVVEDGTYEQLKSNEDSYIYKFNDKK